jgi:uncharacterized protein (TIGR02246 family)
MVQIVSDRQGVKPVSTATTHISPEEQAAINGLLLQMGEAWERGDGAAYGSVFTDDARYVSATGTRTVGREQIAASHQQIFDSFFAGTRLGSSFPVELQPLATGLVLIHASGAVLFAGEPEQAVAANGLLTMVAVATDDGWRIASFANTPTGKARSARFVLRYLRSRLRAFQTESAKARTHMLRQKRDNIARWRS